MHQDMDENSPLTYVNDINGEKKIIPKSTLLWILTEPSAKFSNDRIRRFKSSILKPEASKTKSRKRVCQN